MQKGGGRTDRRQSNASTHAEVQQHNAPSPPTPFLRLPLSLERQHKHTRHHKSHSQRREEAQRSTYRPGTLCLSAHFAKPRPPAESPQTALSSQHCPMLQCFDDVRSHKMVCSRNGAITEQATIVPNTCWWQARKDACPLRLLLHAPWVPVDHKHPPAPLAWMPLQTNRCAGARVQSPWHAACSAHLWCCGAARTGCPRRSASCAVGGAQGRQSAVARWDLRAQHTACVRCRPLRIHKHTHAHTRTDARTQTRTYRRAHTPCCTLRLLVRLPLPAVLVMQVRCFAPLIPAHSTRVARGPTLHSCP